MDFIKKNISLFLGLLIPVAMVVAVAAMVYIPGLWFSPQYDFVYSVSGYNRQIMGTSTSYEKTNTFYRYDVIQDQATEIQPEEAENTETGQESPDGYHVEYGSRSDIFSLFFGGSRDYNLRYLVGHGSGKKLNLNLSGGDYYNFNLVGWTRNTAYAN